MEQRWINDTAYQLRRAIVNSLSDSDNYDRIKIAGYDFTIEWNNGSFVMYSYADGIKITVYRYYVGKSTQETSLTICSEQEHPEDVLLKLVLCIED